jgi:UDP-3-O-[3-hydroxymyristoyl] glucosamine N-acyltransferase
VVVGDREVTITGAAGIKEAREGDVTFLSHPRYLPYLERTRASAVITAESVSSEKKNLVRTANPSSAFTKVLSLFAPAESAFAPGVHPTAVLHPGTRLGGEVCIGPHVVIEDGVSVGDHSAILE